MANGPRFCLAPSGLCRTPGGMQTAGRRVDEPEMGASVRAGRRADGAREPGAGHQRRHDAARGGDLSSRFIEALADLELVSGCARARSSSWVWWGSPRRPRSILLGAGPVKDAVVESPVGDVQRVHRSDPWRRSRALADGPAGDRGVLGRQRGVGLLGMSRAGVAADGGRETPGPVVRAS